MSKYKILTSIEANGKRLALKETDISSNRSSEVSINETS